MKGWLALVAGQEPLPLNGEAVFTVRRKHMSKRSIVLWLLALFISASAGFADAAAASAEEVTNAAVIELHQMGLGAEVILEKIKSSQCDFDVSIEGLRQLKQAGIPQNVISEMIRVTSSGASSPAATGSAGTNPADPSAIHEPVIYYYEETGGPAGMVALEPTVYMQSKQGGVWKSRFTYGIAKVKSKAILNGPHARLQIQARKPTFYFETTSSGLASSGVPYFSAASSANEFVLVRSDVKKNSREIIVGQFNAWGSAQAGVMDEGVVPFDFEKMSPGVYRVTPREELVDGEYCFFYGGTTPQATYGFGAPAGGGKVFDFGISPQP
jgi:hypothetical protein